MNFAEAESYLYSLGNEVEAMKLGLENIRTLLAALGDPQNNYTKVQVAGTNGKGSVCAFLNSICLRAGIETGLYTSPHLVSITERIKVDGVDISEEEFSRVATLVRERAERLLANGDLNYRPTFFEQMTAIALVAFAEARVELAILETGLGGRLDATTAANAEIAAITQIALDHQEYLGETIEEIAAEKAGIITEETEDVVIGRQSRPVMAILRNRCREFNIQPINDGYDPWCILPDEDTVKAGMTRQVFFGIRLGLRGRHQFENAQTALQIAEALLDHGFFLDLGDEKESRIVEGLKMATHPGRLEYIGNFLLDGAHNIAGAEALSAYLDEFVDKPITMIFGAMKEKDVSGIAEILWSRAEQQLILTRPSNSRAMRAGELLEFLPKGVDREKVIVTDAVEEAIERASSADLILVTGSLYLIGEVRSLLIREQILR